MAKKKTPKPKASKAKTSTATTAHSETKDAKDNAPRKLKKPEYTSFKLQKRIKSSAPKLPGGFRLLKQSVKLLGQGWKPFLGIIAVYMVLNALLVQSFSNVNLGETKTAVEQALSGNWQHFLGGLSLFTILVGSSSTASSELAGIYQFIITFLCSLAIVWALRQVVAGRTIRVRDGFYEGMYPLVPVFLVLLVIFLQLLPLLAGVYVYNVAGPPAVQASGAESLLWAVMLFMLVLLSIYMLCSSLFALYIASLPGMQPMAALRSARKLVRYRRWMVIRRLIVLPFVMFFVGAAIIIPIILAFTPAATWVFFGLSLIALPLIHSYMYGLYRELIREET